MKFTSRLICSSVSRAFARTKSSPNRSSHHGRRWGLRAEISAAEGGGDSGWSFRERAALRADCDGGGGGAPRRGGGGGLAGASSVTSSGFSETACSSVPASPESGAASTSSRSSSAPSGSPAPAAGWLSGSSRISGGASSSLSPTVMMRMAITDGAATSAVTPCAGTASSGMVTMRARASRPEVGSGAPPGLSTAGVAARGGSDTGRGGSDTGRGGSDTGRGGSDTGRGGSDTGRGGPDTGRGASDTGRGASDTGRGASDTGRGASDTGRGGSDTGRLASGGSEIGGGGSGSARGNSGDGRGGSDTGRGGSDTGRGGSESRRGGSGDLGIGRATGGSDLDVSPASGGGGGRENRRIDQCRGERRGARGLQRRGRTRCSRCVGRACRRRRRRTGDRRLRRGGETAAPGLRWWNDPMRDRRGIRHVLLFERFQPRGRGVGTRQRGSLGGDVRDLRRRFVVEHLELGGIAVVFVARHDAFTSDSPYLIGPTPREIVVPGSSRTTAVEPRWNTPISSPRCTSWGGSME